jgi:hypothetical protein
MVAGGAVGAAIGAATTPAGTDTAMHAAYWGLASATTMAITGLFVFDEQKRSEELERKLRVNQKELNALRFGNDETPSDEVVETGTLSADLPGEMQPFFSKMKWKRKLFPNRLTHWVQRGDNSLVRECEVFEFSLPGVKIPSFSSSQGTSTDPRLMDEKTMSKLLGVMPQSETKENSQ